MTASPARHETSGLGPTPSIPTGFGWAVRNGRPSSASSGAVAAAHPSSPRTTVAAASSSAGWRAPYKRNSHAQRSATAGQGEPPFVSFGQERAKLRPPPPPRRERPGGGLPPRG